MSGSSSPTGPSWGPPRGQAPVFFVANPDDFYRRLGTDAKMAFGEAYVAGDWTAGADTDLADLLTPFAAKLAELVPAPLRRMRAVIDRQLPRHTKNTRDGAKIQHRGPLRHVERPVRGLPRRDDDVLVCVVRRHGERIARAGATAQDRRHPRLRRGRRRAPECWRSGPAGDPWRSGPPSAVPTSPRSRCRASRPSSRPSASRSVDSTTGPASRCPTTATSTGEYDAIVSVEMIEAVGEEFWPSYFSAIDQHLAPGGRVAIQAITMEPRADARDPQLLRLDPEVHLPRWPDPLADRRSTTSASEHTDLPRHPPARTRAALRRDAAPLARPRSTTTGPRSAGRASTSDFRRTWEFYLAYCEAGFASRYLGVSQLRLARPADEAVRAPIETAC